MAKQTINIGSSANDGTGDPIRTAFDKVNDNFNELYSVTAAGSGNNVAISSNSIVSENTNGNIVLDPNGTGRVVVATGAELRFTDHVDNAIPYVDSDGDVQFTSKLTWNNSTATFSAEDISIQGGTISTTNSNQDIALEPSGTGEVNFVVDTQTGVGAAGAATALPAQPTGYLKVKISGTEYVMPFYARS